MFGLGKKKSPVVTAPVAAEPASAIHQNTVIYSMPKKFRLPEAKPFWTAGKVWSLVVVTVVLILGGLYWWIQSLAPVGNTPPANSVANEPVANIPPLVNEPADVPAEIPPGNSISNEPITNEPNDGPTEPATPPVLSKGSDTDADGLTDAEEQVFGSSPTQYDSDGDKYPDGSEALSGYNPNGANKLAEANLLKSFSSQQQAYSLLYPSAWSLRVVTDSEGQVQISIDADEKFTVSIDAVPLGTGLAAWYSQKNPDTSGSVESFAGHSGIFSTDRRQFSFLDNNRPDRVVTISYDVGNKTVLNYPNIFQIIVNSFKFNAAS